MGHVPQRILVDTDLDDLCDFFTNCRWVFTAIVANQSFIKGKRLFGVVFLLPWAVPAFITIMSFSNMFNDSMGRLIHKLSRY